MLVIKRSFQKPRIEITLIKVLLYCKCCRAISLFLTKTKKLKQEKKEEKLIITKALKFLDDYR